MALIKESGRYTWFHMKDYILTFLLELCGTASIYMQPSLCFGEALGTLYNYPIMKAIQSCAAQTAETRTFRHLVN